jgi:hypothetical protein
VGIERKIVSAKIDTENDEWLERIKAGFYPFSITRSSLVNACLTFLRLKTLSGEIALTRAMLAMCSVNPLAAIAPAPMPSNTSKPTRGPRKRKT